MTPLALRLTVPPVTVLPFALVLILLKVILPVPGGATVVSSVTAPPVAIFPKADA